MTAITLEMVLYGGAIGLVAIGAVGLVMSNHLFRMLLALVIAEAGANLLIVLVEDGAFLAPLLIEYGTLGELISAGTLPLLSLAVGLKVGSELAGLMAHLSDTEASDP